MNKKEYMTPAFDVVVLETEQLLVVSKFSTDDANPNIVPTDGEFNGEFN